MYDGAFRADLVRELMQLRDRGLLDAPFCSRLVESVEASIRLGKEVRAIMNCAKAVLGQQGFAETEYTERTCIIVMEIQTNESTVQTGIVVDAVTEVLPVREEEIEPAPEFGASVDTRYILGMANMENTVKILLDIDRVLSSEEIDALVEAA